MCKILGFDKAVVVHVRIWLLSSQLALNTLIQEPLIKTIATKSLWWIIIWKGCMDQGLNQYPMVTNNVHYDSEYCTNYLNERIKKVNEYVKSERNTHKNTNLLAWVFVTGSGKMFNFYFVYHFCLLKRAWLQTLWRLDIWLQSCWKQYKTKEFEITLCQYLKINIAEIRLIPILLIESTII